MNPDTTERVISAANPVPNPAEPPIGAIGSEATLALLEKERGEMTTTKAQPNQTEPRRPRRRGVLAAAAAFAIVMIVGAVMALASLGGSEGAPATTEAAPPTTEAAPPTTEAATTTIPVSTGRQTVEAAFAAYSSGDIDRFMTFISADAELREGPHMRPNDRIDVAKLRVNADFGAAIGERYEIIECEFNGVLSCSVAVSDDFTRGVGLVPVVGDMTFAVFDEQVVVWRINRDGVFDLDNMLALGDFIEWHEATYPDEPSTEFGRGLSSPADVGYIWKRSKTNAEITPLRIQEYLETRN